MRPDNFTVPSEPEKENVDKVQQLVADLKHAVGNNGTITKESEVVCPNGHDPLKQRADAGAADASAIGAASGAQGLASEDLETDAQHAALPVAGETPVDNNLLAQLGHPVPTDRSATARVRSRILDTREELEKFIASRKAQVITPEEHNRLAHFGPGRTSMLLDLYPGARRKVDGRTRNDFLDATATSFKATKKDTENGNNGDADKPSTKDKKPKDTEEDKKPKDKDEAEEENKNKKDDNTDGVEDSK